MEREKQRFRVLKSAKIVLDDWSVLDCAVRDISATGAKIATQHPLTVPDTFRLLMVTERTIRPVRVSRRGHETLGILFLGPPTKAPLRKF